MKDELKTIVPKPDSLNVASDAQIGQIRVRLNPSLLPERIKKIDRFIARFLNMAANILKRCGATKTAKKVDYFNFFIFEWLIRRFGHAPKPKLFSPLDNPKNLG